MKLNSSNFPLLTSLKYGALMVAFALGYQVAGKNYPEATAIVGWVLGFVVGIKLHLTYANKQ